MATDPTLSDPLLSLRQAIAGQALPTPTTSADVATATANGTDDLAQATHLYFPHPVPRTIPLNTPTRFVSAANEDSPVDLRSIFFAWQKKDVAIPEYIESAQVLNEALKQKGNNEQVLNLVFVERLDLITWLEGASDESEYIKPLEGEAAAAAPPSAAAAAAEGAAPAAAAGEAGAAASAAAATGRPVKAIDPRLQQIYNGERKIGDRNSVLRGIKPTDFSHVRKTAEIFLGRNRSSRTGAYAAGAKPGSRPMPVVPTPSAGLPLAKKPGSSSSRRPDPIILLSPSASSPIRLSNIKSFLQDGVFVPPDHPTLASDTKTNILYIMRETKLVPSTSSSSSTKPGSTSTSTPGSSSSRKPTRFIFVDNPSNFQPDYWQRLVAVFTTGQAWQFKNYKWSHPPELFKHAVGIHVSMAGDTIPETIKEWGRGVVSFTIARWDEKKGVEGAGRWQDREVVQGIWSTIEARMRAMGWGSNQ